MSLHIMIGDWRTENPSSRHFAEPLPAFYRSVDDRAFAQKPADQSGAPTAAMRPNVGYWRIIVDFPKADTSTYMETAIYRICLENRSKTSSSMSSSNPNALSGASSKMSSEMVIS